MRRPVRRGEMKRAAAAGLVLFGSFMAAAPALAERPVPPCDIWVYVKDPDPKGVNLRAGPGIGNKVVAVIPKDRDGTIVHLVGSLNGWMQVAVAETVEGKVVFKGRAWGHGSRFAVATRGPGRILDAPRKTGKLLGRTPMEYEMTVAGCRLRWLYVKSARGIGWLAPDNYCGSPVTTCP